MYIKYKCAFLWDTAEVFDVKECTKWKTLK
jgi:hypothetical protein